MAMGHFQERTSVYLRFLPPDDPDDPEELEDPLFRPELLLPLLIELPDERPPLL